MQGTTAGDSVAHRVASGLHALPQVLTDDAQVRHGFLDPFALGAGNVGTASGLGVFLPARVVPDVAAHVQGIVEESRTPVKIAV